MWSLKTNIHILICMSGEIYYKYDIIIYNVKFKNWFTNIYMYERRDIL